MGGLVGAAPLEFCRGRVVSQTFCHPNEWAQAAPLKSRAATARPSTVKKWIKERFDGEMDYDSILFLIGLQELGKPFKKYKKDEKLEVMHVAICSLLEPYGFYEFMGKDDDGWPHWKLKENLPFLDAKQQNKLIIDSIIDYFKKEEFI
jgi:hypothetical protein